MNINQTMILTRHGGKEFKTPTGPGRAKSCPPCRAARKPSTPKVKTPKPWSTRQQQRAEDRKLLKCHKEIW